MRVYIPVSILEEYISEGTVFKRSLTLDHHTTVQLPAFLAFFVRKKIKRMIGCKIEFVYKHPDEGFVKIIGERFGKSPEEQLTFPTEEIRNLWVASRYFITDTVMRGLYELYRRMKERGLADRLLTLSSLEDYGSMGEAQGARIVHLLNTTPSFPKGDKKATIHIVLPHRIYGLIRNNCIFTDFTSFLIYSLLLLYGREFNPLTRHKYLEGGLLSKFEADIIAWIHNAEMEMEREVMMKIESEEDLEKVLADYLLQYPSSSLGFEHQGFTEDDIHRIIKAYGLTRLWGRETYAKVAKILGKFEEKGVAKCVDGVWVWVDER